MYLGAVSYTRVKEVVDDFIIYKSKVRTLFYEFIKITDYLNNLLIVTRNVPGRLT